MRVAVRAIVIENNSLLVMYRHKFANEYYTLVGGQVGEGESADQALAREVMEETCLQVTGMQLVFYEKHPEPYNEQYIYFCTVAPHGDLAIQAQSEEGMMNKREMNIHRPEWVGVQAFARLPFRTPQLHQAIVQALKKGFPAQPIQL